MLQPRLCLHGVGGGLAAARLYYARASRTDVCCSGCHTSPALYSATSFAHAFSASGLLWIGSPLGCFGMSDTHQPWSDEYTSTSAGTFAAANASRSLSFASGCRSSSFLATPKYIRALIFGASRCGLFGLLVTRPPPWNEAPAPTRSGSVAAVRTTSAPPMQ